MHRLRYFSRGEWALWGASVGAVWLSFWVYSDGALLSPMASTVGLTSLIFCAKGHPVGQALMIVFSALYGVVSFSCAYYGEMLTYLGMTMPMAVLSLVTWLRHPFEGRREVAVARLSKREALLLLPLTATVTALCFPLLHALGTASLAFSTFSVATSFAAAYLTFRRSPYFALVYAANDAVLIVLWILASKTDRSFIPMLVCFAAFFANDLYGFLSWRRMQSRQEG